MFRHLNYFESDDRALEQNCLFVRNRYDNHQVSKGSGANIPALPHNYKVITPIPDTLDSNHMGKNCDTFHRNRCVSPSPPSPPRMVNWSQYSKNDTFQKEMGNYFDSHCRNDSVTPPPPSPPRIENFSEYLNGLNECDASRREMRNNSNSRRHNRSLTPSPPSPPHIGHISQYCNKRNEFRNHKRERSRSPVDCMNRKIFQQQEPKLRSHEKISPYRNERDRYRNPKRDRSRSPVSYKNRRNFQQNLSSIEDLSHYRNQREEYRSRKREKSHSPINPKNRRDSCERDKDRSHKRDRSCSPVDNRNRKNSQQQEPNFSSIQRDHLDQNMRMENVSNQRAGMESFKNSQNMLEYLLSNDSPLPTFDYFVQQKQANKEIQFLQNHQNSKSRDLNASVTPVNSNSTQSWSLGNVPNRQFCSNERIPPQDSEQYFSGPPNMPLQNTSFQNNVEQSQESQNDLGGSNATTWEQSSSNSKKGNLHVSRPVVTENSVNLLSPIPEDLKSSEKSQTLNEQITLPAPTFADILEKESTLNSKSAVTQTTQTFPGPTKKKRKSIDIKHKILKFLSMEDNETSNEIITKLASTTASVFEGGSPPNSQSAVSQTTQNLRGPKRRKRNKTKLIHEKQTSHSEVFKCAYLRREENQKTIEQITKPASTSAGILEDTNLSMEDNETSNEIITKPASTTASVFEGGSPQNSQSAVSSTTQNLRGPKRRKKNKTKLIQEKQTSHSEVLNRANLRREGNQKTIEQITERASTSAAILEKESTLNSKSAVTQTTQTFPGPTKKKRKSIDIKQKILKIIKDSNFAEREIPIDINTFPEREIIMPTAKNWCDWFKSNSWIEKNIMNVSETDSEVIETLFKKTNVDEAKKCRVVCLETLANLLTSARLFGKYQDPYNFLKCVIILPNLITMKGIHKRDKIVYRHLFKQIHMLDMIKYFKLIICMWKKSYGTTPSGEIRPTEPLPQSVNEKAFNWLVLLAFKELKRISRPVVNSPNRLDQLKQLYEFTSQVPPEEMENILKFHPTKDGTLEELVRSTIDKQTIYLEEEGEITKGSSKALTIARMHLMSEALDEQLSAELRKEKDDFLAKLKVNSFARQNYDLLIHNMLTAYARHLDAQKTDPRLKFLSDREISKVSWIRKCDIKIPTKFLLDERLSEYGSYLNEEKIAIENTRNLSFDVNGENVQPIPVPKAKEDQYKDLHEFASGYDPEEIQNISICESLEKSVIRNMKYIISYIENPLGYNVITKKASKKFAITKVRLADKTADETISEDLKKEKYALLEMLKKNSFAQENYDYLLEDARSMHVQYLYLSALDREFLKDSEEMEILKFESLSKNHVTRFIWKHLLDERLAETGSFCNAYFVAEENLEETSDVENPEEEQNNTEHYDRDENIVDEKVEIE